MSPVRHRSLCERRFQYTASQISDTVFFKNREPTNLSLKPTLPTGERSHKTSRECIFSAAVRYSRVPTAQYSSSSPSTQEISSYPFAHSSGLFPHRCTGRFFKPFSRILGSPPGWRDH